MKIIKLKIQRGDDRENMIKALANGGYKVWVEKETDSLYHYTYYVIFEIKE